MTERVDERLCVRAAGEDSHRAVDRVRLVATQVESWPCVIEVEPIAVSFVIAVLPPNTKDVIFCSEGRELALWFGSKEITEQTTALVREDFLKTLALSKNLCIGVAGHVDAVRRFLMELLPHLPWDQCAPNQPPTNFADAFAAEHKADLLDINIEDCCSKVEETVKRLNLGKRLLPTIGGTNGGGRGLFYTSFSDGKYSLLPTPIAFSNPPGFKPSLRYSSTDAVVLRNITNWPYMEPLSAERRCLDTVETVAEHCFTCNKNVTFRRLSQGFVREGREVVDLAF
jgi:hypothetical protein